MEHNMNVVKEIVKNYMDAMNLANITTDPEEMEAICLEAKKNMELCKEDRALSNMCKLYKAGVSKKLPGADIENFSLEPEEILNLFNEFGVEHFYMSAFGSETIRYYHEFTNHGYKACGTVQTKYGWAFEFEK